MLLTNIKSLLQVRPQNVERVLGLEMNDLPTLDNAWLLIDNGQIVDFGPMDICPDDAEIIDCTGKYVLPTFADPHTHLVFAKPREEEFVMRIEGLGYEEIAARGGGILNSAKKLQETSEEQLFNDALARLKKVMKTGTGAIEIKSGYGLSVDAELKMLRVIKRLKAVSSIPIKANFLGAHAFPTEFKENHQGYIDLIISQMLPKIAEENLADYIDVFCERGYYNPEETAQILEAGVRYGLKPKIHVNQFSLSGGVQIGVKLNALSVDHLEVIGEEEIEALKGSSTIPILLPSCSFFLSIPYGPARDLMNANLPLALATDYNPGSTPSGNLAFVLSLACVKLRMTPNEAINAMTINAAAAMEVSDEVGSITKGKQANLIITKPMPSIAYWPYAFGEGNQLIDQVLIAGEVV
ncbi:MAG: imidazolonepropionase [Bacteroidetes bacterium]|nr:imidazolonepropionase [Bacteroidota bacterium]